MRAGLRMSLQFNAIAHGLAWWRGLIDCALVGLWIGLHSYVLACPGLCLGMGMGEALNPWGKAWVRHG